MRKQSRNRDGMASELKHEDRIFFTTQVSALAERSRATTKNAEFYASVNTGSIILSHGWDLGTGLERIFGLPRML